MNPRVLLLLLFSVDIWVCMFILHRGGAEPWSVKIAGSSSSPASSRTTDEAVQIWFDEQGQCGWMDDRTSPVSYDELQTRLAGLRSRRDRLCLRLLCDPGAKMRDWGPLVERLGKYVDELRVGPLPPLP